MARYFVGTGEEAKTVSVKRIDERLFWCSSCDCAEHGAVVEIDYTSHFANSDGKIYLCQDCFDRLKEQINSIV